MSKIAFCFAIMMVCLAPLAGAAAQIGEPAPKLSVAEWLKGKPIEIKPGTNIFVIEIWTTTSRSSRAVITNLNSLQTKYADKGVVVIGVSDEPADKIKEFLQGAGAQIQYTVVADDDHRTSRSYMAPLRQLGVPYTFVVGTNATLLWHGAPSVELNQVVDQLTSGQFSAERTGKSLIARRQMEQYLGLATRRDPRVRSAGRALIAARTNNLELLCDLAYQIAVHPRVPNRDIELANEALDQAQKLAGTNTLRVDLTRVVLLFETGKTNEAVVLARQTLASANSEEDKHAAQGTLGNLEARIKLLNSPRRPTRSATNLLEKSSITNLLSLPTTKPADSKSISTTNSSNPSPAAPDSGPK